MSNYVDPGSCLVGIEQKLQQDREKNRLTWENRTSFVLAAVGFSVGLGNLWRFPYLVSKFGGATFLFPYFVALLVIGMPILAMEISLGTFFQAGDADAFGSIHPRLRGIGVASAVAGYTITFYYTVIITWALIHFVQSFQSAQSIGWVVDPATNFMNISLETSIDEIEGRFNWPVFVGMMFTWTIIFLCLFRGISSASIVIKFTVPVPIILIVILIIRGSFLDGAADGVTNYIRKWNTDQITEINIWQNAIGQVFFSLGICMGAMTAYSSHNDKASTNVALCEKLITFSDTLMSVLSGFAVYQMLGNMQVKCEDLLSKGQHDEMCTYYNNSSTGMAFEAFPDGLSELEVPQLWGVIFFGCLILLGIDSAFALVETMATVIKDSWICLKYEVKIWKILLVCCLLGYFAGIVYSFDVGTAMLDCMDNYIENWGMIFIGMLECFAIGWVYHLDKQIEKVGTMPMLCYNVGFFVFLTISSYLSLEIHEDRQNQIAFGVGFGIFFAGWLAVTIAAVVMVQKKKRMHLKQKLWIIMGWPGADALRQKINNAVRPPEMNVWIPNSWKSELEALYRHDCICILFGFIIKYVSCTILFSITLNNVKNDFSKPYGGYPSWLTLFGRLFFALLVFIVAVIAIFPRIVYDPKYSGVADDRSALLKWYLNPTLVHRVYGATTSMSLAPTFLKTEAIGSHAQSSDEQLDKRQQPINDNLSQFSDIPDSITEDLEHRKPNISFIHVQ